MQWCRELRVDFFGKGIVYRRNMSIAMGWDLLGLLIFWVGISPRSKAAAAAARSALVSFIVFIGNHSLLSQYRYKNEEQRRKRYHMMHNKKVK